MIVVKNGTLPVHGANIYYEVRGSGPFLLMIHGGGGEAEKFQKVADNLADRYTVITYDRRGHSRSIIDNPAEDYSVSIHSEDAHRLLSELTNEPAFVFGSSSGAVIGLDLSIRHPEQIRVLIPHEPVLLQLLFGNELEQAKQFLESLKKNHRSEVLKLLSTSELDISNSEQSKDVITHRLLSNSTYFVKDEIPGIINYSLDIDALQTALKSSSMQVLPAGGSASRDFFTYGCSVALAEQLGTNFVEFPGHHGGYNSELHKEFAEKLHDVFR
ncbi:alpha/beta fold hydrolase [Aneurinibacillus aneurinilyticus]|jgi:pimeloyl-ACP methyl ester carboxylesterase|uniref:alpha/beta fold hydrolase n=2 Tax=Aneurinibacillus aneurinilyticus TaxID=1391 RepID=UPI0023F1B222|nr:alpha/beta hydrolase [Aneurinibacillus aneurinilyticus]MCI1696390.1 alpha/beta hydrolase [Aneurinibacillus aneurinilyticus]MED0669966.1 alpha/beta hydrolase [Aneurinibacillus aneurinilyticus]